MSRMPSGLAFVAGTLMSLFFSLAVPALVGTPAQSAPTVPETTAARVYRLAGASVVNITSLALVRTPGGVATQPEGVGSGFVLDDQGHIVTNNHVIQDAAQLTVTFADRAAMPAKLLGRDPDNDLAVLQVDDPSHGQPATLGDSDALQVGQDAVAIGSPLGLQQTVTAGIVSAIRPPFATGAGGTIDMLGGAIQTDAAINPGNSGGPLLDANGAVVGVNSAILSQSGGNEGIGLAIPINVVKRVVPELIQNGRYRHPQVGVTTVALNPRLAQALGIPEQQGLLVQEVTGGAAAAGIQPGTQPVMIGPDVLLAGGDVIVAVDGQSVTTPGELRGYIENQKHPGDQVTLTVSRGGQQRDVVVTLGERPASRGS